MLTPEEIVQKQVEAYNAHDLTQYSACYHPLAIVSRMSSGQMVAEGREQIERTWGYFFSSQPKAQCKILSRLPIGRFIIDHEEVSGLADGSVLHAVAIYEVNDGLITRVWLLSE